MIVGIAMLKTAYDMYPEHFEWKKDPYEYVYDINPIDVVCGTDKIRKQFEAGVSLREIEAGWAEGEAEFAEARKPYLLY